MIRWKTLKRKSGPLDEEPDNDEQEKLDCLPYEMDIQLVKQALKKEGKVYCKGKSIKSIEEYFKLLEK